MKAYGKVKRRQEEFLVIMEKQKYEHFSENRKKLREKKQRPSKKQSSEYNMRRSIAKMFVDTRERERLLTVEGRDARDPKTEEDI